MRGGPQLQFQSPPERGTACKHRRGRPRLRLRGYVSIPSRTGNGLQEHPRLAGQDDRHGVSIPSRTGNGLQATSFVEWGEVSRKFQSPPERGTACKRPAWPPPRAPRSFNPLQNGERPASARAAQRVRRRHRVVSIPSRTGNGLQEGGRARSSRPREEVSIPSRTGNGLQGVGRRAPLGVVRVRFNPLQNGERPASRGHEGRLGHRRVFQSPPERGTACKAWSASITSRPARAFQSPPERGTACKRAVRLAWYDTRLVSIPSRTGNGLQGKCQTRLTPRSFRFNPLQNGERPARPFQPPSTVSPGL